MNKYRVYWSIIVGDEVVEANSTREAFSKACKDQNPLFKAKYPTAKVSHASKMPPDKSGQIRR